MTVVGEQGRVRAEQVVLAGNCHLGGLAPTLRAHHASGHLYHRHRAAGRGARAPALPGDDAVSDCHFVLDYFRRSADHRLLFGGKVSYSGLPPANLKAAMRPRHAQGVSGSWRTWRLTAAGWFCGHRPQPGAGFWPAGGQYPGLLRVFGHGVALTGLAGRLIAEVIVGQPQRLAWFQRFRHARFPGGRWLRTPALVLGMAYYRLRDWL